MASGQGPQFRVVVLTQQSSLAEMVKLTLNHGIYVARDACTTGAATALLGEWQPHLAVVDLDYGGDQILPRIAPDRPGGGTQIPVLALTRRGDLKTRLAAFNRGVDIVMSVPISPEELLAQVIAIARRRFGQNVPLRTVLMRGDLKIDILNRRVRVGSSEVHMTGLEFSLLYLLAANAGQILTRDEILDALWSPNYEATSNVVDQVVRGLRSKLNDVWRKPRFIATVPGYGYRFV